MEAGAQLWCQKRFPLGDPRCSKKQWFQRVLQLLVHPFCVISGSVLGDSRSYFFDPELRVAKPDSFPFHFAEWKWIFHRMKMNLSGKMEIAEWKWFHSVIFILHSSANRIHFTFILEWITFILRLSFPTNFHFHSPEKNLREKAKTIIKISSAVTAIVINKNTFIFILKYM